MMNNAKKFLAILMVIFVFCLMFTSCGKKETPRDNISYVSTAYDYKKVTVSGSIPELNFKLKDSIDDLTAYYKNQEKSETSAERYEFKTEEKDNISSYTYGMVTYYCNTNKKDLGISAIAVFDTAFGYSSGFTTLDDVKEKVGDSYTVTVPTEEEGFFIPGGLPENSKMLTISEGENTLKIFFVNELFIAVFLSNDNFSSI